MLGEVPISVISPPSSDANDIGIRKTDGEVFDFFAIWNATGISIATAPMFFTSAEAKPTLPVSTINWVLTLVVRRWINSISRSIAPDRWTAPESTSADPTMITMSSEKPRNASSGETTPTASAANSAMTATRS